MEKAERKGMLDAERAKKTKQKRQRARTLEKRRPLNLRLLAEALSRAPLACRLWASSRECTRARSAAGSLSFAREKREKRRERQETSLSTSSSTSLTSTTLFAHSSTLPFNSSSPLRSEGYRVILLNSNPVSRNRREGLEKRTREKLSELFTFCAEKNSLEKKKKKTSTNSKKNFFRPPS